MKWLQRLNQRLALGDFLKGVLAVAGGTAAGQAITIVAAPLLTRLFTPGDFGVLAVFQSMLGMLAPLAAGRYEFAIPLASDDHEAGSLTTFALLLVCMVSSAIGGIVWLYGGGIVSLISTPGLTPYLWLLPLGLLGTGVYQVLNYRVTRAKRFNSIGITRLSKSVGQTGTQVGMGISGSGPLGLLAGVVMGRLMGITALWRRAELRCSHIQPTEWWRQAAKWRRFPMFTAWSSMVNVMGTQAPPILLARFFVPDVVGFFSLTLKILSLPAALVGQAVGQVFYPTVSREDEVKANQRQTVERTATGLFLIALPTFAFVGLTGPFLFEIVFGEEWGVSGTYAQIMAPMLCASFVSSPLSMFVLAKQKQSQAFGMTIYETTLRLGALWFGGQVLQSDQWAIGLFSAAGVVISLVYIGWVLRLSGSGFWTWFESVKTTVLVIAMVTIALIVVRPFTANTVFCALSALSMGAIGAHTLRRVHNQFRNE